VNRTETFRPDPIRRSWPRLEQPDPPVIRGPGPADATRSRTQPNPRVLFTTQPASCSSGSPALAYFSLSQP